jgi:hypothetical protein
MPAAQPLSLDALRRLIADNDYWNPHSAQHQELQRTVSEGFGRLYPAKIGEPDQPIQERNRLDVRDQYVRDLQQRYLEILDEKAESIKNNVPTGPEYDDEGRLVKDYVPIRPGVLEHQERLEEEFKRIQNILEQWDAVPGWRQRMK